MYKKITLTKTSIQRNESVEGETIETKVKRALTNGEGIADSAQVIYTERKHGVLPEYDIRTDRWEVAVDAMDKISRDNTAKRKENIVKFDPKNNKNDGQNEGKNGGSE